MGLPGNIQYCGGEDNLCQYGTADGPLRSAAFANPIGIVRDANTGLMYVAENYAIRMLTDDQVIRVAGWKGGTQLVAGFDDGPLSASTFSDITDICTDAAGNVYVAERGNKCVGKIFFR